LKYLERFQRIRVVLVTDKGEPVAKDGFEYISYYGTLFSAVDGASSSDYNKINAVLILASSKVIGTEGKVNYYQYFWNVSTRLEALRYYGTFTKSLFAFYLRDQYGKYQSGISSGSVFTTPTSAICSLHKRMNGYEIWYFDRKYYAAGYSNSNSEGGGDSGDPPIGIKLSV
jgi:hypothetical protein